MRRDFFEFTRSVNHRVICENRINVKGRKRLAEYSHSVASLMDMKDPSIMSEANTQIVGYQVEPYIAIMQITVPEKKKAAI